AGGRVHVPQSRVPPQPSAIVPQFAPTAAHVVGVQHVPDDFLLPGTHTPLQQRGRSVRHVWPSGTQGGPALATRHPTPTSAPVSTVTKNGTGRISDRFMTPPMLDGLPEGRCATGCPTEGSSSQLLSTGLARASTWVLPHWGHGPNSTQT